MKPGSVDALNALSQGTILCDDNEVNKPPNKLATSWRKKPDGSWVHWHYDEENDGVSHFLTVHPTDEFNLDNLSRWTIHPASPYIITEDEDLYT